MADNQDKGAQFSEVWGEMNRRGFLQGIMAATLGAGLLAGCDLAGQQPQTQDQAAAPVAQSSGECAFPFGRAMKAAFTNAGLGATWCAQGKEAAEKWGKWLGVEVTWFDGGLSIDTQRKAVEDMAAREWDFVAIQAFGIDTLVDPVKRMIDKGIPVIQMDTTISKDDIGITTFLEPDNIFMGEVVSEALFKAIGGAGAVIMTQGALGHTGAQKRATGFEQAIAKYPNIEVLAEDPADWDVNKVAQLWEDYLVKFPNINAGYFHNDDMALAASKVIKNAGREKDILLGGIDAMPQAITAVKDGTLLTSVRNPSCRIHWGAVVIGGMAASGVTGIPKYILMDGPVVTAQNADGLYFMEEQLLL
ncbi:MAG TPA: sugar ABC transporter substrate-binding protein [Anaerolineae bacterium]|nr:sugar ABC transporter substrate-binding protein [Anaerolineae bacterium]HXV98969.1 sugar ABC transporter substrate-binding protein [Anaerolineae bacterium]